ncbi:MAG: hypothetical protein LBM70_10175 [Victivallales bacterium]|jgi:hypothetical protein|nr:hypothetical protein [Victivallales bacterium]
MTIKQTLTAILCVISLGIFANEIPVFNDNFSVKETFVDNYLHKGNVSIVNGEAYIPAGGSLTMMAAPPQDFRFTFTLKMEKEVDKSEPYGIGFVYFGKYRMLLRTDGYTSAGGHIPEFKLGNKYTFVIDVRKQKDGELVTARCNAWSGRPVSKVVPPRTENDRISFTAYKCDFTVDDISIAQLSDKTASPNLIVNSSFEHLQDGMPLYYNTDTPRKYMYQRPYEEFLDQIAIDTKEKVSGKNSLRITFKDKVAKEEGIYTSDTGVIVGQPVAFSVYLKADRDNLPATLVVWERYRKWNRKEITLSKEWNRYELLVPAATLPYFRCGIQLKTPGIIWMDDLQLELASKSSPYKESALDELKFVEIAKELPTLTPVIVPRLDKTPELNGNIDSWISKAAKIEKFYNGTKESQSHTVSYVGCDENNLYIGVRAFVKDPAKLQMVATPRDDFKIFNQENVEILVDPGKTKTEYFQFVAGASGSQLDFGKGANILWNADWKNTAKYNAAKKCVDYEIAIPLYFFASAQIVGDWGFNIGRHDSSINEYSCIYPQYNLSFQDVKTFPILRLDSELLKPYAANVAEANIADNTLNCKISDNSGLKRKLKLSVVSNGKNIASGNVNGTTMLSLNTTKDFPVGNNNMEFTLEDSNGKRIAVQTLYVKKIPLVPVSMTIQFSRYTLSDTIARFRIEAPLANTDDFTAELVCDSAKVTKKASPFFEMELPLNAIPAGTHRVVLTLKNKDGKSIASADTNIVKMQLPEGAARINNFSKCLNLNGKNVFYFMPLLGTSGGKDTDIYPRMADYLADNGFKQCMFIVNRNLGIHKAEAFLQQAKKRAITVIAWLDNIRDQKPDDKELLADIERLNRIGCIAAWKVLDEPDLWMKENEAKQWMLRMMKLLPAYPVFMNNVSGGIRNRYADYTTDILMLDNYITNTEGKTVKKDVMPFMDLIVKASSESRNQPRWFWLAGNNTHNHYRETTAKEQIAQTWGCIVTGCTGLAYFMGSPNWPANWKAYKQLNKDVNALNDVILSEGKCENATLSDKNVRWMTRKYQGYVYVFAVNVDPDPAGILTVTLPGELKYNDTVEVEFENRKISLKDGKFSDRFDGYERHVYKVKLK